MISVFNPGPRILMYHSIVNDHSDDAYSVAITAFQEQISWLRRHGFEIIHLSSLHRLLIEGSAKNLNKKVVVTFDDGYKDFLTNALPVLKRNEAPATVFIVTEMLGQLASWSRSGSRVRLMSEDEIVFIKTEGISIGSHTAGHVDLTLLEEKELVRQLCDSYDKLTRLGESFYSFSYPWGQSSTQVRNAVKACGYVCAVGVNSRMPLERAAMYLLPRITMRYDMRIEHFASLVNQTPLGVRIRRALRNSLASRLAG
jgi:peptidoglycan/xylan/chitin deacetylase (PgdA/CDA1 family)